MQSYPNRFLISPIFCLKFSSANGKFWSNFTQISHSSVISWCTWKWHWKRNNWHPGNDYGRMRDKRAKIRDIPSKVRLVATLVIKAISKVNLSNCTTAATLWVKLIKLSSKQETAKNTTKRRHLRLRRPLLSRPRSSVMVIWRPFSSVSFSFSMAFFMSDDDANSTTLRHTTTSTTMPRNDNDKIGIYIHYLLLKLYITHIHTFG